jgi:ATP adenylyltransferase
MHQNLWAPWRMSYLRDLERRSSALAQPETGDDNFLLGIWNRPEDDGPNHVITRTAEGMILLNRYPYANGHLLVALGDGRPSLTDYDPPQRAAFWQLVDRAAELCQLALNPQGLNIGVNQGRAAGAGVPSHLHAHVVPRWGGDTNFITVVGELRVIPDSLEAMAARYREVAGP